MEMYSSFSKEKTIITILFFITIAVLIIVTKLGPASKTKPAQADTQGTSPDYTEWHALHDVTQEQTEQTELPVATKILVRYLDYTNAVDYVSIELYCGSGKLIDKYVLLETDARLPLFFKGFIKTGSLDGDTYIWVPAKTENVKSE